MHSKTAAPQRFLGQFPTPTNREIFSASRVSSRPNREFCRSFGDRNLAKSAAPLGRPPFGHWAIKRPAAAFVDALELKRYVLYVFDYGAPVGLDLAVTYPERVAGIVSQNGNTYVEGLRPEAWDPLRTYWASPSSDKREPIRARMTLEGVRAAYFHGLADPSRIEPEAYTLDAAILARSGNAELQLDLK